MVVYLSLVQESGVVGEGGRRGAAMKGTISIRIIHGIHEEGDIERDIVKGHQGASCYCILQHQSSPSPTCQS